METTRGAVHLRELPSSDSLQNQEPPEHAGYTGRDSSSNYSPLHDEEPPSYNQVGSTGQTLGHSTLLHRSAWVSLFSIIYVGLVIYTWAMTVILSIRPLKANSWVYSIQGSHYLYDNKKDADFHRERKIYRSVRTIQTFLQVVTLPWISTVCASAAVIFAQNQKDYMGLRLRQVTTLADRKWMDFSLYPALIFGRWRQYGSTLLAAAIFIWVFGLITYPIQSLFLSSGSVKVRTYPQQRVAMYDFGLSGGSYSPSNNVGNVGMDVVQVRDALNKANSGTFQPNLWSNDSGVQFLSLNDMSSQTFYSQLPGGFNTGLIRQFAPRVNSTATYEIIEASQFPVNCRSSSDAFYAEYSSSYSWYTTYSWGVIACMPGNMTESPWQMTRNRQDFSEVLYLNMTQEEFSPGSYVSQGAGNKALYRITVNTTAGFFELPNYMNKGLPGPLLDQDPVDLCDQHCLNQSRTYSSNFYRRDEITASSTLKAASLGPISTQNKGPLLSIALATFGPGSFVDTVPTIYANLEEDDKVTDELSSSLRSICIGNPPLSNLLGPSSLGCISIGMSRDGTWYPAGSQIAQWIHRFQQGTGSIPSAFTAAAFLANKEFLSSKGGRWSINQDLGTDMDLPTISLAGIIVVSILMGLYLLPLLALSLYAGYYPRWTERLDSFVMLRFGAFAGDKVFPLLVGRKTDKFPELDEMSGVVRDMSTSGDEPVEIGRLGFGEGKMLREGRRYESFKGDDEPLNSREFQRMQWNMHRGS